MPLFIEKHPRVIEAWQVNPNDKFPDFLSEAIVNGIVLARWNKNQLNIFHIKERDMLDPRPDMLAVNIGDWITYNPIQREFYEITNKHFSQTYKLYKQ